MNNNLVTRFAPSPTGFLHIGNARTAIFNWLLAKHYNGKFYLRIEDTDRSRFSQEAVDIIFESLQFLGINWDNADKLIYQSERTKKYQEMVEILLKEGKAYKCFHTQEETEALKEANPNTGFRSQWRDRTDHPNAPYIVRLKTPNEGKIHLKDIVQGDITVKHSDIEDFTLLRSDGTPTYMLAVVLDDHEMEVNQVIRGADHLTNTFKQLLLFQAMGWEEPKYGHIPLIHDSDGKKLSKRAGAIGVLDYAQAGILPQALFNYLMRLGWGYKNEEFIPLDHAIEIFSEKGFGKSAAKFDTAKLTDLNAKWIRDLSISELYKAIKTYSDKYMQLNYDETNWGRFYNGLDSLRTRAKTLKELLEAGKVYFNELVEMEIELEECEHIIELENFLTTSTFDENLEQNFRNFCTDKNLEFKKIAPWLRKKLTGQKVSPGLFEVMLALGKDLTIKRLKA